MQRKFGVLFHSKWLFFIIIGLTAYRQMDKSNRYFGFTNEQTRQSYPVISDGAGYYAYLPQWFIYKDPTYSYIDSVNANYQDARFNDNFAQTESGQKFNKYFVGTAIFQMPFFLIAHFLAQSFDLVSDGYSPIYQCAIVLSAYLFAIIGFYFVLKVLSHFQINGFSKLLTVIALAYGTNLSYYVVYYSSYSHVYSFAAIAYFVYLLFEWRKSHFKDSFLTKIAVVLGLIFIIRPTNACVMILLPFMMDSFREFTKYLKDLMIQRFSVFLKALLLFAGIVSLQFFASYYQLGKWTFNNYSGEHFDFLFSPKFYKVLFSYDKGLLVFAPVLLLSFIGFIVFFKQDRKRALGFLVVLFVFTYLTASWWCWWYGGGLGMRPFVDVLVFLAVPMAILIERSSLFWKTILVLFVLLSVKVYQVYQFQMLHNILHYDRMTKEQFWSVFMEKGSRFEWTFHMDFDHLPTEKALETRKETIPNDSVTKYFEYDYGDDLRIVIDVDTNYQKWAGTFTSEMLILGEKQNPGLIATYYLGEEVVLEKSFSIGGKLKKLNTFIPIEIHFVPNLKIGEFDRIEIHLIEAGYEIEVKDKKFISRYY